MQQRIMSKTIRGVSDVSNISWRISPEEEPLYKRTDGHVRKDNEKTWRKRLFLTRPERV